MRVRDAWEGNAYLHGSFLPFGTWEGKSVNSAYNPVAAATSFLEADLRLS